MYICIYPDPKVCSISPNLPRAIMITIMMMTIVIVIVRVIVIGIVIGIVMSSSNE